MDTQTAPEPIGSQEGISVQRTSERELVVTRTIGGPAATVFEAWTDAELFRQWWVPKSFGLKLLACEIDARVGGGYRLTFDTGSAEPMAFFGRYLEVAPPTRLVWTNEEDDGGTVVTTVTFEEGRGRTQIVVHDQYPSKESLDEVIASGAMNWNAETFDQLDEVVASRDARARR